jgi:lysine-ketoglutarate reductase/saccharopine dehydrogenase-like protein (TIGR00300 family)
VTAAPCAVEGKHSEIKAVMFTEDITLKGHIIDSLTLAKVLDETIALGGSFQILDINIGKNPYDVSNAVIRVKASNEITLKKIIKRLSLHGSQLIHPHNAKLVKAPKKGVFPEGFYSTTNLETWVRYKNRWLRVTGQEMDVGIRFDKKRERFYGTPMSHVKKGEYYVVGHEGVRVSPLEKKSNALGFRFMTSKVSAEKPKSMLIIETAHLLKENRKQGKGSLFVLGPVVVHSGGVKSVVELINKGWITLLFAGNALAAHDIEAALYGTSLGVSLEGGDYTEHGYEHHLRAINKIRLSGSIDAAVKDGVLTSGIMHACVKCRVPFILAGSIRDDGPLPEVITESMSVQEILRKNLKKIGVTVVVGTVLHGIAVGNLLPAHVPLISVDINPSSITKFTDRGSWQSVGIVMDGASFINELAEALT